MKHDFYFLLVESFLLPSYTQRRPLGRGMECTPLLACDQRLSVMFHLALWLFQIL
jgi:hypothetical protein